MNTNELRAALKDQIKSFCLTKKSRPTMKRIAISYAMVNINISHDDWHSTRIRASAMLNRLLAPKPRGGDRRSGKRKDKQCEPKR